MRKAGVASTSRHGGRDRGSSEDSDFDDGSASDSLLRAQRRRRERSDEDYNDALEGLDVEEIERRRQREQHLAEDAPLDEIRRVFLSRDRLALWCNEPFFEETVIDFLVRVSIGKDPMTQAPLYKIARISGVRETTEEPANPANPEGPTRPKKYTVGSTRTDKVLELRAENGSVRSFRLIFISGTAATDQELTMWLANTRRAGERAPTRGDVEALVAKKKSALNFRYTDAVVRQVLEKRRQLEGARPVNLAADRHTLIERCEALRAKLAKLETIAESDASMLDGGAGDSAAAAAAAETEAVAVRSDLAAAERDLEKVESLAAERSAVMEQNASDSFTVFRRNQEINDGRMMRARAEEEDRRVLELTHSDPSQRRLCQPKVLWATRASRKEERERKAREEAERANAESVSHEGAGGGGLFFFFFFFIIKF
jgi:hypothetical protein